MNQHTESISRRYLDTSLPLDQRVADLVSQLTLREKIAQLLHSAPPVPRLGIPAYNWWNECLHGVGRAGRATVFPQAIGMAASFNEPLLHKVATVISDEARAKHHDAQRRGNRGLYQGLTFWTPNINILRDPRWGRAQETYGEDPFLTARLGVAFVKGLQGNDPKYLKVVATPKHYAVHSGPESSRHSFDSQVSQRDLRETYLFAFRACVTEGNAQSIMTAYNRTNGEACSASPTLLGKILRGEWQFDGYVVSDCGAIEDIHQGHKITDSAPAAAALAIREGCDLCCGEIYKNLLQAVQEGLVTEAEIETCVTRLFRARFRLGMFDPETDVPWARIPPEIAGCDEHRDLSLRMARESIVLLKNDGTLPLTRESGCIGVVGPGALNLSVLLGNYYGFSPNLTPIMSGIVAKAPAGVNVLYHQGCEVTGGPPPHADGLKNFLRECTVLVAVLGNTPEVEGEEGDAYNADAGGDRAKLGLPGRQQELLEILCSMGKPVVLVLTTGSPLDLRWAQEHAAAILCAWYPGEAGGAAIADVLFGDYNPAGRLPVTFVKSADQLPPFEDYAMRGRTYRFMESEPLYRFGYGLSYTTFAYSALTLSKDRITSTGRIEAMISVTNTGDRAGDEVVQAYLQDMKATVPVPRWHLIGFKRLHLLPGETKQLKFQVTPDHLVAYDDAGAPIIEPGDFQIHIGGAQPDDPHSRSLSATFAVTAS